VIWRQLEGLGTIINVGAGAGSYEPPGTRLVAVEPSQVMLDQRPAGSAPPVQAHAEHLPLADRAADGALAVLTLHHWTDWRAGLAEMCRVARRVVILSYDPDQLSEFWLLRDYLPHLIDFDRGRLPPVDEISRELADSEIIALPVPRDMKDGVLPAYWCRPAAYLDPVVQASNSVMAQSEPAALREGLGRLADDLASGVWAARYADLDDRQAIDPGFVLIVGNS
jgi:SAM-dependent methyltransferase